MLVQELVEGALEAEGGGVDYLAGEVGGHGF